MSKSQKITIRIKRHDETGFGHYNYQGGKTTFDNRPRRQRTRNSQKRNWGKEYE